MRLSQADLADLLDVSRASLSEATSEGYKCQGYPVRAWAVFDGAGRVTGYDVPSRVVERSNPSTNGVQDEDDLSLKNDVIEEGKKILPGLSRGRSWPDAAAEAGSQVSANVGAATVAHRYADVVEENPQLMGDVIDLSVTLGAGGILALGTDSDTPNRGWKIAAGMIGTFATFNLLRWVTSSGSQGTRETGSLGGGQRQTKALDARSEQRSLSENGSASRSGGGNATTLGSH